MLTVTAAACCRVVLERAAPPSLVEALEAELRPLRPFAYQGEPGSFAGAHTARNGAYLLGACPSSQALATHPLVHGVARALLSPRCRRVALAVASEIRVEGESPAQVSLLLFIIHYHYYHYYSLYHRCSTVTTKSGLWRCPPPLPPRLRKVAASGPAFVPYAARDATNQSESLLINPNYSLLIPINPDESR
eukprot:SAG31_NODE_1095_length_9928_cov_5.441042_6_plen_191_part_00